MNDGVFVNHSFNKAITDYLTFKNGKDSSLASSFLVYTVYMLNYIYGETDIINPYINRKNNGTEALFNNLKKYGASKDMINKYLNDLEGYVYQEEKNKYINSQKNIYFTYVQEDLIDLYFIKAKSMNYEDRDYYEFKNLLYTKQTTNGYRREINSIKSVNEDKISEYFNYKMFNKNNKITFKPLKSNVLDQKVYDAFNLSKDSIDIINQKTLNEINDVIYSYFKINPLEFKAKEKLYNKVDNLSKKHLELSNSYGKINITMFISIFGVIILLGIIIGIIIIRGI